jgi:hypothetical protein
MVGRPDVIGPGDIQALEQVGIDLVFGIGDGDAGPAPDGLDAHEPHEPGDVAPSHLVSQATQFVHDPAAAVEGY